MNLESALILGNSLGVLLAVWYIVANRRRSQAHVGQVVADVTLESPQRVRLRLSQWRGQTLALCLLTPWDAESAARRSELAALTAQLEAQAVRAVVVIVSGNHGDATMLAGHLPASAQVLLDGSERAAAALRVPTLPATLLVDAQGRLFARVPGFAPEAVMDAAEQARAGRA